MSAHDTPIVLHVGYPKTGTTTFQVNVFPHHPDINYIGKFIPSHRFRDDGLSFALDALLRQPNWCPPDLENLKQAVRALRAASKGKVILLSSEAFIHPIAPDIAAVAQRLAEVFEAPCRVWITLREQISLLLSFFWMHGRHGQYLAIDAIPDHIRLSPPLSFAAWLGLQRHAYNKNLLPLLHYDQVIKLYRDIFGSENVQVLLYEELRTDPAGFYDSVSALLGVDGAITRRLASGKHENPSQGRSVPWQPGDPAERAGTGLFGQIVRRLSRSRDDGNAPALLDELRDDYRQSNQWIARELGLPLARYGYSV